MHGIDDCMKNVTNQRALAYILRDSIELNMIDIEQWINEQNLSIDCLNSKKNYLYINPNNHDIKTLLINYVIETLKSKESYNDDINSYIENNLDVFFDITNKDDEIIIIEVANN